MKSFHELVAIMESQSIMSPAQKYFVKSYVKTLDTNNNIKYFIDDVVMKVARDIAKQQGIVDGGYVYTRTRLAPSPNLAKIIEIARQILVEVGAGDFAKHLPTMNER